MFIELRFPLVDPDFPLDDQVIHGLHPGTEDQGRQGVCLGSCVVHTVDTEEGKIRLFPWNNLADIFPS